MQKKLFIYLIDARYNQIFLFSSDIILFYGHVHKVENISAQ